MPRIKNLSKRYIGKPCKLGHTEKFITSGVCISCDALWGARWRKNNIPVYLIRRALQRAKEKKIAYNLTDKWAIKKWTGRCSITGINFTYGDKSGFNPFSASIDRINPKKGYTTRNCRFILNCINSFKGIMTDKELKPIIDNLFHYFNNLT